MITHTARFDLAHRRPSLQFPVVSRYFFSRLIGEGSELSLDFTQSGHLGLCRHISCIRSRGSCAFTHVHVSVCLFYQPGAITVRSALWPIALDLYVSHTIKSKGSQSPGIPWICMSDFHILQVGPMFCSFQTGRVQSLGWSNVTRLYQTIIPKETKYFLN